MVSKESRTSSQGCKARGIGSLSEVLVGRRGMSYRGQGIHVVEVRYSPLIASEHTANTIQ